MPRASYTLKEPNGKKFRIGGSGPTRAAAIGEANAKLALTVGDVIQGSISDMLSEAEQGLPHTAGTYSDAEFSMKNSAGNVVTVHLENISNAYGDGVTGDLILTNADLIAFASAYRDGAGAGGYLPYGGKFVP
jgi:hypothetical protein